MILPGDPPSDFHVDDEVVIFRSTASREKFAIPLRGRIVEIKRSRIQELDDVIYAVATVAVRNHTAGLITTMMSTAYMRHADPIERLGSIDLK